MLREKLTARLGLLLIAAWVYSIATKPHYGFPDECRSSATETFTMATCH